MLRKKGKTYFLEGPEGLIEVPSGDDITLRLAMLYEGECEGLGPSRAAKKLGLSRQRYFQLRSAFEEMGASALACKKRGPKTNYRRTAEVI